MILELGSVKHHETAAAEPKPTTQLPKCLLYDCRPLLSEVNATQTNREPMNETSLRDSDFPMGRYAPQNHPKRQQNAPEYYSRAPKFEAYFSPTHGCFIRSKCAIVTTVIEQLLPSGGGGRFMIKKIKPDSFKPGSESDSGTIQQSYQILERDSTSISSTRKRSGLPTCT